MGESITEGTVAVILKKPGDVVVEDDVIAQLETDKVTMDIKYQNKTPGIVKAIQAAEGDTVTVGQAFAVVEENADAAASAPAAKAEEPAAAPAAPAEAPKQAAAAAPPPPKPAAAAAPKPAAPAAGAAPPAPPAPGQRPERRVPMTRLRRRVAERLKGAQNTYAMLSTFNEVDMTAVMEMRKELKDAFLERHGVKLGFMSAFVKAAGAALQYVPAVNGVIDGNDIIYRDYYDISVAVSTPKGLVVPVLRDVDKLSFADVEKTINELGRKALLECCPSSVFPIHLSARFISLQTINELGRKARDGTLSIDEMAGGTFTISNGGVFGSVLSTPIINPPQSAILGMHATNMRPWVVNGQIVPRPIMNLALTYDHRLIDGREAVTFLKRIKEIVEDPRRLLLDVAPPALPSTLPGQPSSVIQLEMEPQLEKELQENGFRSTRRTKLIATIGPACDSEEMLEQMAVGGMNVARLNLAHGTHAYHQGVVDRIRKLNQEKGYSVAVMMDTEGSEVHIMDLPAPIKADKAAEFTFTVRDPASCGPNCFAVSYDAFVEDAQPGDLLVVDGGMVSLEVLDKAGPDITARVVDPGLILSRANLVLRRAGRPVRSKNAHLPVISAKDWRDIDMAIAAGVDFICLSFVKSADAIKNLKSYVESRASRRIEIVAKIESLDALPHLDEIIEASDAVMVARSDLGAQVPFENVPSIQKEVVTKCRRLGKPVIVASHLLQSMHTLPTPTRAEVSDIADCVRQRADALMLCGETAAGAYPLKSLEVCRTTSSRIEEWMRQEKHGRLELPAISDSSDGLVSEQLCAAAVQTADALRARAIFVFTRRGVMASLLSRCRPDAPIFAFTDKQETRQMLNLRWGVCPFRMDFAENPTDRIYHAFQLLKARGLIATGDLVVVVADVREEWGSGQVDTIRSVQVRHVV
ncbi:Pyruvate kinase isozyme chloroplastic isoform A [Chlorella sorokiniana]|uniref:Multifunctional fusion protein n=1 Tax=Chlorella sorokiniana TaxID=3076 RepID=A0A2P6TQ63_CHLSO|nr:Pyruvate kinase isozyme chloroplastic isoform A [Chlorella sorokiniana]|eukprot:PRW56169.1 Pyruvate kinase isozyme chloroplastic isoform A [Chlorella sorokiniana]